MKKIFLLFTLSFLIVGFGCRKDNIRESNKEIELDPFNFDSETFNEFYDILDKGWNYKDSN